MKNNKQITAVIIDDEEDSRTVLKTLLNTFHPQVYICGETDNINKGYELIIEQKPQVVFLDIQMPGGNGFDLIKKFAAPQFEVVFITSYDQYAIEAIKFNALDYLLKPIELQELNRVIKKLHSAVLSHQTYQLQLVNVISHIENQELEKKIAVHQNDRVVFLPLPNITHLEGERNYTTLHTTDKQKYTSSKNLGEFEEMLEKYPFFFRISKSCLVNLNHISNYTKGEPCTLYVNNDVGFEISRRKKQEFLERIKPKNG
jgi:two-component system LytT family response regulator